ncbi:MFS transporter, DHA2 family, multidrug resistance protein [Novimethylophilus kurashikiensis]|uniref:MFS transporter, DHA2 family, multidrug resistance protein n=1 Tax=Novimethylophilus kurashikiensis TaxID=1825523 RepID=A0A2R5F9Y6_9PROT|nr:DHA2 family efflux MFS transporter permease subunit [Novimethylophilus kurashikiensis]GBG13501.1 MFS transporter, DHA2 family, multidrug resistance protein [Novimethylophilus kurashikiensis]
MASAESKSAQEGLAVEDLLDSESTAVPQRKAPAPLAGGCLALGTVALSLATFMNVLDTSIANVSLPAIAGNLGVAPNQATWVITSFAVANAISIPLTGWLTLRFGAVRLFVTSILLFVFASLLCGLAPSIEMLILFRVIQGAVAGPMIPLSQSLLLSSYPQHKSGTALAMWSLTTLVAPIMGPLLGGYITDNFSWPWIFYINIPVGIGAAWVTWAIYHRRETPKRKLPVDKVGLALLVVWVGTLQIALDKGKELDWFESPLILGLTATALVSFVVFLIWELTEDHPVVDLKLFARRNFTVGVIGLALGYGVFFGNVVLLPLWLQQYMGYTATWAGLVTAPVGLLALLFSPWVGKNVNKYDPRLLTTVAFLVFAVVFWMRSRFTPQSDVETLLIPTLLQGVSMAFFFIPLVSMTLSGMDHHQIPAASGLSNFMRITAGAFGTSISTTVWDNRASLHHAQLIEHITPFSPESTQVLDQLQQSGLTAGQATAQLNQMINQQAFMRSADDIFYVSAMICVLLVGIVWLARPVRSAQPVDAGGAH